MKVVDLDELNCNLSCLYNFININIENVNLKRNLLDNFQSLMVNIILLYDSECQIWIKDCCNMFNNLCVQYNVLLDEFFY